MLRTRTVLALFLAVMAPALLPGNAGAHRFGGPNDPCERKIGSSLIHITLYQPQFDPDAEYCDEVPRGGNTVLVVDILGDELRRMPIGVEVLARQASESRRVLSMPPKIYRRGVADAQMELDSGGAYLTQIAIGEGPASQIISFPIRVAPWYRAFVKPVLILLALLALIAISVIRYYLTAHGPLEEDLSDLNPPKPLRVVARKNRSASNVRVFLVLFALAGCVLWTAACNRRARAAASLPDVRLIDDHGNPVSLGSLRGKVVLLDFIHVGCPGVCSNLVNKFGQVADSLGPELGSRVVLLSVTNDPEHDSPAELLKLARSSQADMSGWLFVTGKPGDVNRVIRAFGLNNERLPDGSPNHITQVFLLGRDLRQVHEFQGMVMNSDAVAAQIKDALKRNEAIVIGAAEAASEH